MDVVIAAAVGALAAILGNTIPSLLTVRAERRAAAAQVHEERLRLVAAIQQRLIEDDASAISEAVDSAITSLRELARFAHTQKTLYKLRDAGKITAAEASVKEEEIAAKFQDIHTGLSRAIARGGRRAYALTPDVRDLFLNLDSLIGRMHKSMIGESNENQLQLWPDIWATGGRLQSALRSLVVDVAARTLDAESVISTWNLSSCGPDSVPTDSSSAAT